ncbi:MAG: hypothetical protein HZB25_00805 [Candidatus Eisenbacteria bacterium]|nr:hypothetical protein [Candidatus Eisenbacteria bacterium]
MNKPTWFAVLTILAAGLAEIGNAAGIGVETYSSMAAFQSSPLYTHITGGGGASARKVRGVRAVRQGPADVPPASAGGAGNAVVTTEIEAAAKDVPDVLSLNSTASFYNKKFVSLGTNTVSPNPFITLDLEPVSTLPGAGYSGYDIVIFDLGKNLASGTGNNNTEATTFEVELVSSGVFYPVGTITATMGNFINAILLDITGIPGIPVFIDAIRITDVTGAGPSTSGGIDVDGVLTLNVYVPTPVVPTSWGQLKTAYR